MRSNSTHRHGRLLAVLLSCLLLSQWLALAHSVVHPAGRAGTHTHAEAPGHSLGQSLGHSLAQLLHELDSSHVAGSTDCLTLDQLCHGAPGATAPVLPLLAQLAQPAPATPQSAAAQPQWRRQLARAPPVRV